MTKNALIDNPNQSSAGITSRQAAALQVTGRAHEHVAGKGSSSPLLGIQSQIRLAVFSIRSMPKIAAIRKDRPNLLSKVDLGEGWRAQR